MCQKINFNPPNLLLKKWTFLFGWFFTEGVGGFFQNFLRMYFGSKIKFLFFFLVLSASISKLQLFSLVWSEIFFHIFGFFWRQTWKSAKIVFLKFLDLSCAVPRIPPFLPYAFPFLRNPLSKNLNFEIPAASKWPKSPTRPRVFATPRCARLFFKNPLSRHRLCC